MLSSWLWTGGGIHGIDTIRGSGWCYCHASWSSKLCWKGGVSCNQSWLARFVCSTKHRIIELELLSVNRRVDGHQNFCTIRFLSIVPKYRRNYKDEPQSWIWNGWLLPYPKERLSSSKRLVPLMAVMQHNKHKAHLFMDYKELNGHVDMFMDNADVCVAQLREWCKEGANVSLHIFRFALNHWNPIRLWYLNIKKVLPLVAGFWSTCGASYHEIYCLCNDIPRPVKESHVGIWQQHLH